MAVTEDGMKQGYYGNMVMISSQTINKEVWEDWKALSRNCRRSLIFWTGKVIQHQLGKGIIEGLSSNPVGREFYILWKPVVSLCTAADPLKKIGGELYTG